MQKEWDGSKVDIYLEDAENEKWIRRSFPGVVQGVTDEQVNTFTQALRTLNGLPVSYSKVVEEYRYTV